MGSKMLKRFVLSAVSLCMTLTQVQNVVTNVAAETLSEKTQAQIIAENYDHLTDYEKEVLASDVINTEVFKYDAPTNDDAENLITINTDTNTVSAKEFKDSENNIWVPVEATYVDENGVEGAKYTLDSNYQAVFTPTSPNYDIKVKYQLTTQIDDAVEERLINTGHWLITGVGAVKSIASADNNLKQVANTIDALADIAQNGYTVGFNSFTMPENVANNIIALINEKNANGGQFITYNLIDEYSDYDGLNEIEYLFMTDGALKLREAAKVLHEKINAIAVYDFSMIESVLNAKGDTASAAKVKIFGNTIKKIATALEIANDDSQWIALTKSNLLKNHVAEYLFSDIVRNAYENDVETEVRVADKTDLLVDTTTIQASVNRYNVSLKISAKVHADENGIKELTPYTEIITMKKGATKAEVEEKIQEILTSVLLGWTEYNVGTEYYVEDIQTGLGDTLTEDVTYSIEYTPKTFKVTIVDQEENIVSEEDYEYGSYVTLPKAASGKSYDYALGVGGTYNIAEGSNHRVINDVTYQRREGKEKTKSTFLTLIANDIFKPFDINSVSYKILTSGALKDDNVAYRTPSANDLTITVEENGSGYTITASEYESQVSPVMTWIPYGYEIIGGAKETNNVFVKDGDTWKATITTDEMITGVNVLYHLEILFRDNTDSVGYTEADIQAARNLPYTLVTEAKGQISALSDLLLLKPELADGGTIHYALFDILLDDEDVSESAKEAIRKLEPCFDSEENVILYNELVKIDPNTKGLYAYYSNYETYRDQIDIFSTNVEAIVGEPSVAALLERLGYGHYVEKLGNVASRLATISQNLKAPNEAIKLNSDNLSKLCTLLEGNTDTVSEVAGTQLFTGTSVNKMASNKASVTVNVVVNGNTVATKLWVYTLDANTEYEIDNAAEINNFLANVTVDNKLYTITSDINLPTGKIKGNKEFTQTWGLKDYTVTVDGSANQTVNNENRVVTLPASTDAAVRYDYYLNGAPIIVINEKYTLTDAEFNSLLNGGSISITRKEVNLAAEGLEKTFEKLNNGFGSGNTKFVLTKDANGEYAVVLRFATNEATQFSGKFMGFAQELIGTSYNYMAMGNDKDSAHMFKGTVDGSTKMSIQAIIDAILDSGVEMSTIIDMIDTNGQIIENVPQSVKDSAFVLGGNGDDLGGVIIKSNLFLGSTKEDAKEIDLYITLQDYDTETDNLLTVRESLISSQNRVDVNTDNSSVNIIGNVAGNAYKAILAGMLVTGYADIQDITAIEFNALVDYLTEQFETIVKDPEVSFETIQNTVNKIKDKDLAGYKNVIETILDATYVLFNENDDRANIVIGTPDGYTIPVTLDANIATLLKGLDLNEAMLDIVNNALLEQIITVPFTVTLEGIGEAFEAIIFDNSKDGLNKVWFTKDLAGENLGKNAVVVITSEVGVVEFDNAVIVDLNGQKVDEIRYTGEGTVKVFDSALTDGEIGAIRGNVTIAGGQLKQNAGKIAESYELVDGKVESIFYSISENEGGQVVLKLKPSFINSTEAINAEALKYLAVDLALHGGMNLYTAASMTIDGNTIYQIDKYEDLVAEIAGLTSGTAIANEVLGFINCEGVTAFANDLIAKLTDFEAISGTQLGTYEITTTGWNLEVSRADENYLTAGLINGKEFTKTLVVELADDSMSDVFAELAKVVKVTTGEEGTYVKLSSLSYDGSLHATYEGGVKVEVDFNNNLEYTKLMGIILANYNADLKVPLVKWLEEGATTDFIAEINSMTTADIISAIHKASGKTYAQLLSGAGVSSVDASELEGVEYVYGVFAKYIKAASKALSKLEITGGNREISSFDSDKDCVYVADKENWHNFNIYFSFAPYADNYKEMETTVEVTEGNIVAGYNIIDNSDVDGTITVELDTIHTGITKDMIGPGKVIDIKAKFGTIIDMDFTGSTYTYEENGTTVDTNRLFNGATFTVVAQDHAGNTETITILVKILGDVNANGLVDSNDDLAMAKHYFGQATITDQLALWAADVNGNGSIESNDGLMCAYKYLLGINNAKYKSHLKD